LKIWLVAIAFLVLLLIPIASQTSFAAPCHRDAHIPDCKTGSLYVADIFLERVREYNRGGVLLDDNFVGPLNNPLAIAFSPPTGLPCCLFVADFDHIERYDHAGTLINPNFITGLGTPRSIAFDNPSNSDLMYVADDDFNTIRQYSRGGLLFNANYITGLSSPQAIIFDHGNRMYVVDAGFNTVRLYHPFDFPNGHALVNPDRLPGLSNPVDIALSQLGFVFVVDTGLLSQNCLYQWLSRSGSGQS